MGALNEFSVPYILIPSQRSVPNLSVYPTYKTAHERFDQGVTANNSTIIL